MTRIALSIQTLGNEIHARSPLTTLYYYDDTSRRDSDHDPNLHGVVCAIDVMAGHGLDLHALSREIVATRHPECAYVIYNRQIASRNTGWKWVAYTGSNPHTDHIHVSVGIGKDGYKEPPYDSTQLWLGDDMAYSEEDLINIGVKAVHRALDLAANRSNPTGRQMGDDITTLQQPIMTAIAEIPESTVALSDADKADIARRVAEELRGWSFLPAPKE